MQTQLLNQWYLTLFKVPSTRFGLWGTFLARILYFYPCLLRLSLTRVYAILAHGF